MTLHAHSHRQPSVRRALTPEQIRRLTFSRSPLGRRGVDPEEVELFQRRLAEEIAAGDAENARLRAEIDRLRHWYRDRGEDPDTVTARVPVQVDVQAVQLLSEAQLQAEAYIAQAEAHCRQLTSEARRQAETILHEAQARAEEAAHQAGARYRDQAGGSYAAEVEEVERRLAWLRTFTHAVQVQLQAASEAFSQEIGKLGDLPGGFGQL